MKLEAYTLDENFSHVSRRCSSMPRLSSIMTACKGNQCRYLLCAMFGRIAEVWATADGFRSNSSSEIGNR